MINADPGHFGPNSMMWKVNKEITVLFGGARALLMHVAHPLIAAGARQTSFYQRDPWKRLIRTLSLQNSVTFGTIQEADESANRINKLQERALRIVYKDDISTFQELLNHGHSAIGPGQDSTIVFSQNLYENYMGRNTDVINNIEDASYVKLREIALSYDFGKIRTEFSYVQENGRFDEYLTYFDNSITKIENDRGKLHKDFYIINAYYDFRDSKKFSPFIGLGIGFVNSVQDSAPFIPEYVRQAFVLQLKAGLSYKFSDKNIFYIEGFKRDAKSHTTNDGLGTPYIYEAKNGFDSSGVQVGFRKII